jgi:hypothetical protein
MIGWIVSWVLVSFNNSGRQDKSLGLQLPKSSGMLAFARVEIISAPK